MEVGFNKMTIDLNKLEFRRELRYRIHGEYVTGELFVGDIVPRSDGKWLCHWSLSFVHPEIGVQFGDDPLDALYECLFFVGRLIHGSELDGLQIWWRIEGDHAGFDQQEALPID